MSDVMARHGFWTELEPDAPRLVALTDSLRLADGPADLDGGWPDSLWRPMVEAGVLRWSVPPEHGGEAVARPLLVQRYARLAEASLTAAFVLSQHDAAVRRLSAVADRPRAAEWLRSIARGEAMATVGISQLTTSRRLGAKALGAVEIGPGRYRLDGAMPWVTGAENADVFVTGALLDDGRQMLVALPSNQPGLSVLPAFEIAALQASRTAEVVVKGVEISADDVLMGPSTEIGSQPGAVGTAGLETSALALGQAAAALGELIPAAVDGSDLAEPVEAMVANWRSAWRSLMASARGEGDAAAVGELRAEANSLVLRTTQACLVARRGRGFLRSDPAQRWARQALFFLVWSCPPPIARAALHDLAGLRPT